MLTSRERPACSRAFWVYCILIRVCDSGRIQAESLRDHRGISSNEEEMKASTVLALWERAQKIPFGRRLFEWGFGFFVPYSGTLSFHILKLSRGQAYLELRDRRRLRNHLGSIHAAALMNFAELVTGFAFVSTWDEGMEGILVKFEVQYLKKARGRLFCRVKEMDIQWIDESIAVVQGEVVDRQGEVVCQAVSTWKTRRLESHES